MDCPPCSQYVLSPVLAAGRCLPLRGPNAYVDIKLAAAVEIQAVSYEHLPPSLSPSLRSSAPGRLDVYASIGAASLQRGDAPLLGSFLYDAHGDVNLQTFVVDGPGGVVDHVRVALSNVEGDHCCLYRIRVHGRRPERAL